MREIKFRGWHTIANKMFSAEEMAADQLTLLPTGSFINVNGTSTKLSITYDRLKFIPLQFTGLKDKNGTDIYEGDIMRFFDDRDIAVIIWHFNGWYFEWIDSVYKNVRQHKQEPIFHNISLWTVSGNIYQNPL